MINQNNPFYASEEEEQQDQTASTSLQERGVLDFLIPEHASHEERLLLGSMIGRFDGECERLETFIPQGRSVIVSIIGCIYYPVELADMNTGEMKLFTRSVLLCQNEAGDEYRLSGTSEIIHGLIKNRLLAIFSPQKKMGMLTGPVNVKLGWTRTRAGKPCFSAAII